MGTLPHTHDVLLSLRARAQASPIFSVFLLCSLLVLFTRLRTGYSNSKQQSQVTASQKPIPILPYWLPYIGHAPSFAWSFDDLLTKGRDMTKDGMFGLRMMGSQHFMVLMPSLVKQIYAKRQTVLSSEEFIFWIFTKYFGDGGAAENIGHNNFQIVHQALNSLLQEAFLSKATAKTVRLIEDNTPHLLSFASNSAGQHEWEKTSKVVLHDSSAEVDLFPLLMNYIADLATNVLMGDTFLKNNPGITQDLWVFDSYFNTLLSGVPFITPGLGKAKTARTKLMSAFFEWNNAVLDMLNGRDLEYKWRELSDVSETMRMRLKAMQRIESSDAFNTSQSLALYWGLMVNANKVNFWTLLHIISTPNLLATIQDEIAPFAKLDSETNKLVLDVDALIKSCPVFKATFYEAMRFYTAGVSYKKVLQDVTLTESAEDAATFGKPQPQTYHIAAGNFLVIPHATMQMDPRLWKDPTKFDPYRFLVEDENDPGKKRAEMGLLSSFGGGTSICKGRFFAEREVLLFTAGLIATWDFQPVEGNWEMPGKFYSGTGSANPKTNVRVRMTRRA